MVNGKQKGASFERDVCKLLSLWVTDGERKDCFWRSAMSGGRATVHKGDVRQAGDICSVAPEGHSLTERFYIECKHVKNLNLTRFFLFGEGSLAGYWHKAQEEAAKYNRDPIIIARQNLIPTLLIQNIGPVRHQLFHHNPVSQPWRTDVHRFPLSCEVFLLDDILQQKYNPGISQPRTRITL